MICTKPGLTKDLEARYAMIKEVALSDAQKSRYVAYMRDLELTDNCFQTRVTKLAHELGLSIDSSGRIYYAENFAKLDLPFELMFERHGQTTGNVEPRIFQGQVDYDINQLTTVGVADAAKAVENDNNHFVPDLFVASPLGRVVDTAAPWVNKFKNVPMVLCDLWKEMAFGAWDGREVQSFEDEDLCHLFYVMQNAVIKSKEPHVVTNGSRTDPVGKVIPAECFVEVMARIKNALLKIATTAEFAVAKAKADAEHRPVKVMVFAHSMVGAAALAVLGQAVQEPTGKFVCFDGKFIMPHTTPTKLL